MKLFLFLIPTTVAAVTLAGITMPPLKDTEVDAGEKIPIPCDLKNVKITWYWIPRYPICAGLQMDPIEILSVISNKEQINENLNRFQRIMLENDDGNFSPNVLFQHMNDSGIFYCFDGKRNSSFTSIVVKPGRKAAEKIESVPSPQSSSPVLRGFKEESKAHNRRGMKVPHRSKQHIKLTCNSCDIKMNIRKHERSSVTWTLNGKNFSNDIHVKELKNVVIVEDSPKYHGLWKCSNPRCPTQSDGYCFEKEFPRISDKSETEEVPCSTPAPNKKLEIQVVVGCVIGIIALLGMGVTIFVLWEKLQSRRTSPSKTAKVPKSQVIQNSVGLEKPLEDQGKKKDIEMNEEAEGIQYSELQLKEPEQCQSQKKEGTPDIIYAEMLTSNCSKG